MTNVTTKMQRHSDRRNNERHLIFARVKVRSTTTDGLPLKLSAMLEEISKGGLGLRTNVALSVGQRVELQFRNRVYAGEVRHSASDQPGSFFTGIRLLDDQPQAGQDVPGSPVEQSKSGN